MNDRHALLFYIGDSLVKSALVTYPYLEVPKILNIEIEELTADSNLGKVELEGAILRRLDKITQKMAKHLQENQLDPHKISDIFVVVASPWYHSWTKTFKTTSEQPLTVKEETIESLLSNGEKENLKNYPEELVLLENKIIDISLNGYVTAAPLNKKANTINISVVQSFGEKRFINALQKNISTHLPYQRVHINTLALVSFVAIRDVLKEANDFLLLNVTGLVTEISLIKKNVLHETISVPIGFSKLLDLMQGDMRVSPAVAASLIKLYKQGNVEKGINEKIVKIISEFEKEWQQNLTSALTVLSGGVSLPTSSYLISQNQMESLFSNIFKREDLSQFSFGANSSNVRVVSALDFVEFIDFNKKQLDSSLASIGIFVQQTLFKPNKLG